jgi:uncharacterized damage-inducible protein DinB
MNDDQLGAAFRREAMEELDQAVRKIHHCLDQLDEEQVWRRPREAMNSIGNLLLHLCGNVRQWIVSGVGGAEDIRDRPREFSERGPIAKAELLRRLDAVVADAQTAVAGATADELLRVRRIQGFEATGLRAILHAVAHFHGHTQEIIHLTRSQLGEAYRFDFVPATPEQGAP